jgi:hypothetical protein
MPPKKYLMGSNEQPAGPPGTKPNRVKAVREKPWDDEVEFGGGIPGQGKSSNPKTVANRSNRTSLRGPPLALARLKDTLRQEKSRSQRAGITTAEAAQVVKRPVGTPWSQLTNTEQGRYKEVLNEYMTIRLCRRNIFILRKWNALDKSTQRRLLGIAADEPIPDFSMSREDEEKAFPTRNGWEVRMVNPPFPGFRRSDYMPVYEIGPAHNSVAIGWADAATENPVDDDDPAETVYESDSDPATEAEPVRSPIHTTWNKYNANLECLTG